jgi:undecaprenyl pyrophosphate phosphatase UppP
LELNFLQSLILGLVSGAAEVLPLNGQAHRLLYIKILGGAGENPAMRLMVHIFTAAALYYACRNHILRMLRARRIAATPKKRRKRPMDHEGNSDFKLLTTATVVILVGFCFYSYVAPLSQKSLAVAGLLLLNGLILYIPQYLPGANMESTAMTPLDGLLFGLGGAAAILPGISGVGAVFSLCCIRGMEPKKALNLALLLNIPVNLGLAFFDLIALLSAGAGSMTLGGIFAALFAGIAAFGGVILAHRLLPKLLDYVGFGIFAFYSWGLALLTFVLFLAAV